jgi:hypothetical protein
MYGFSGYATNPYATKRYTSAGAPPGPIVQLAMTFWQNTYGIANMWWLRFKNTTLEL